MLQAFIGSIKAYQVLNSGEKESATFCAKLQDLCSGSAVLRIE